MKLYLLLAAVIFLTACAGGNVTVDENNGLRINEFSANPEVAEYDDEVRILLDVENVGGTSAQCVRAELFGVDSWTDYGSGLELAAPFNLGPFGVDVELACQQGDRLDDCSVQICVDERGALGDLLNRMLGVNIRTQGRICWTRQNGEGDFSGYLRATWNQFAAAVCEAYDDLYGGGVIANVKKFPELTPPLPARNRPGQFVTAEWHLRPPLLPQGTEVDYPITTRVSYFYTTTATVTLRGFNKAEYRRRQDAGQQTAFVPEVVNSVGSPIKVNFVKGTSPIVVNHQAPLSGGNLIEIANYKFEFQNLGNGFPLPIVSTDVKDNGFIFGTVEVRGPGVFFYDCLGRTAEDFIGRGGGGTEGDTTFIFGSPLAKLRSDNTAPFGCTIAIDRSMWVNRPTDTIQFVFNLNYIYFLDKEISIKVLGREEAIDI